MHLSYSYVMTIYFCVEATQMKCVVLVVDSENIMRQKGNMTIQDYENKIMA